MSILKLLNPFASPVGAIVENATDPKNIENWSLVVSVCDKLKESDENLKDGIRAIRKRLSQSSTRTTRQTLLTLQLIESCVKNGDRRVHKAISNREFLRDLLHLVEPQSDSSNEVREKVLSLIQEWRDAFGREFVEFIQAYNVLCRRGYEFPAVDLDRLAPVRLGNTISGNSAFLASTRHRQSEAHAPSAPKPNPNLAVREITAEMKTKLHADLKVVRSTLIVFCDTLNRIADADSNSNSGDEIGPFNTAPVSVTQQSKEQQHALVAQLDVTLHNMQDRVGELLECDCVQDDAELMDELLCLNDAICCAFVRRARLCDSSVRLTSQTQSTAATADLVTLIDLEAEDPTPPFSLNATRSDFVTTEPLQTLDLRRFDELQSVSAQQLYANQAESADQFSGAHDALAARYRALNGEDETNDFDVTVLDNASRQRQQPRTAASSEPRRHEDSFYVL